ncbi:Las1-like-domain-containing protein [Lactifluus subvellereus]|nr:Las1-like-domain-containing protein [Lactifluus subvellereus]
MQLPRRVPWATLAELDQLCLWVYSEDAHDSSRILAIERKKLSAWKFMMPLPHALESLLSLLVAIGQDKASGAGLSSSLSLRQTYATAVIRLVNGLVDPLQMGTYARSIQSIATQIGLPTWLVELRHAATHEDLPSLELLRDGAKESLSWLLHNYFLPTLNPALARALPRPSIRPLDPLLRQYKSLLKVVSRDASLRARHEADISGVLREIERWVAEARVAADAATSEFACRPRDGYGQAAAGESAGTEDDEPEPRETWALDRLCEALLARGVLVPVSRKKRVSPKGLHYPPPPLLAIWIPLLESLAANHVHFHAALLSHILARLLADDPHDDEGDDAAAAAAERASYDVCLAAWGAWLIEWHSADEIDVVDVAARREDVFYQLVQALLGPQRETPPNNQNKSQPGARALLTALCTADRRLAEISATILSTNTQASGDDASAWRETDLDLMEARLKAALSLSPSAADGSNSIQQPFAQQKNPVSGEQGSPSSMSAPSFGAGQEAPPGRSMEAGSATASGDGLGEEALHVGGVTASDGRTSTTERRLPDGWRLLPRIDGWRPWPMGVYIEGE